jgi:hypothetical protein
MNQFSIKGHPSCPWSKSQQTPSSPTGPPPGHSTDVSSGGGASSSVEEQAGNIADIANAISIARKTLCNFNTLTILLPK